MVRKEPYHSERQYVNTGGADCPWCGVASGPEEKYGLDMEEGVGIMAMECYICGATWEDVYYLEGYQDLKPKEGNNDNPAHQD